MLMILTPDQKLSANFTFGEMVRSDTAERIDDLMLQQLNPPGMVLDTLLLLCQGTLQPIRDMVKSAVTVTSGYRCLTLNRLLLSKDSSAHVPGEAADLSLPPGGRIKDVVEYVNIHSAKIVEVPFRDDVTRSFWLFALICLNLESLDIDQVIHEYGSGYGKPAWVHVSASSRQNKREILVIGRHVDTENHVRRLTVREALELGV